MTVLFVAYHFQPYPFVGAKRMTYWAENFTQLESTASVDVITTTPFEQASPGVRNHFVVPLTGSHPLSKVIRDEGLVWKGAVRDFLKSHPELVYDHVVISGGPFMHFGLVDFFKKRWGCQVILDYRDPFANNPRFGNQGLKTAVKQHYEKRFNRVADHVLSVNPHCVRLLSGFEENGKYAVVPNGYDEREFHNLSAQPLQQAHDLQVVYAGSIYPDRDPALFLKAAEEESVGFHHIGRESDLVDYEASNHHSYGMRTYLEMLQLSLSADIGLVVTMGAPFETTTKIYDYMGLGLPILIVTNGEPETGSLHEETKEYPVIWTRNTVSDIREALGRAKALKAGAREPRTTCSRREGLRQLIELMRG